MSSIGHIRKRKDKDGRTRYQMIVEVWRDGRQFYKSKTFSTEKEAKVWGNKTRYEIDTGKVTKESLKKRRLSDAIEKYITDELPNKQKNAHNEAQHLRWWNARIGHLQFSDISPSLIAEHRDKLLKEPGQHGKPLAASTVLKYLCSLSCVFEIAIKEWHWIEKNPVRMIRKPHVSNTRTRFLSEEELKVLLPACKESRNPYLYFIVVLALSTGMRRGEILGLRWEDLDFEKKLIVLTKTKNGSIRYVPMVDASFRILKNIYDNETILDPSHNIFPSLNPERYIDIRSAWHAALNRAEIKNFTFHDLRHSCASFLAMSGATQRDIAEILGHRDLRMTYRYTHLSQSHLSETLQRATDKFITHEV